MIRIPEDACGADPEPELVPDPSCFSGIKGTEESSTKRPEKMILNL
jgi:hypothetical protein